MRRKSRDIVSFAIMAAAILAASLLTMFPPQYSSDATYQKLISETVLRGILLFALLVVFFASGYHKCFPINKKEAWTKSLWILPCLLCVLANFPFSSLIQGTSSIERMDCVWLFALYTVFIGGLEEILFRVIFLDFLLHWLGKRKHGLFLAVFLDSAIFGLYHLFNLFSGGGFGPTMLQVGYSFLIGGMFAICLLRTKNILYPILLHIIFDFGGFLVPLLGHGGFQDMVFWILTIVFGVLNLAHCLFTLYHLDKENEAKKAEPIDK